MIDPDWQTRIGRARRIQEAVRRHRDANPVEILRYRPLRPYVPTLRLP